MARIILPFLAVLAVVDITQAQRPGAASYVVSTAFPTSVFSSYYVEAAPTSEPQPAIFDPVLNITYPANLTNPEKLPTADLDAVFYPLAIANFTATTSEALVKLALSQVNSIIYEGGGLSGNCSKCIAALSVGKLLAQTAPSFVPDALVKLCQSTGFASNSSCQTSYGAGNFGAIWTQVLALADVTGLDGRYICSSLSTTFCAVPSTSPLNVTGLFPKPKPKNAVAPKASGKFVKVLHLSDFHLDARYEVASEANCTSSMCCRYSAPSNSTPQILLPAPLYGAYK